MPRGFWTSCLLSLGLAATALAAAAPIRFALVSDPHVNRGTAEDQPLYRGRFERVIAAVNAEKVSFVLITGDLTQGGKPVESDDFKQLVTGFTAPVHYVPGNHDVGGKRIAGKDAGPTEARVQAFEDKLGPSFYVHPEAGLRLIGINSAILGSGLPVEEKMWALLDHELAQPGATPTIVFSHYPLFLKTPDEPGGEYWNIEPAPRARLLALLKRGGVQLMLSGHLHYSLTNHVDGIWFLSTLPVSFGLPRAKNLQGWTLVTLPTDGTDPQFETRLVKD